MKIIIDKKRKTTKRKLDKYLIQIKIPIIINNKNYTYYHFYEPIIWWEYWKVYKWNSELNDYNLVEQIHILLDDIAFDLSSEFY